MYIKVEKYSVVSREKKNNKFHAIFMVHYFFWPHLVYLLKLKLLTCDCLTLYNLCNSQHGGGVLIH